jgi:hypothetical protein
MFFSVFYAIHPKWHCLEPLIKGFIEKMAYLAEFWLILESDLVESAPHEIFSEMI